MTDPAIVKELRRVQQRNADHLLLPADVVEAARDSNSPLHRHFLWDDRKAGREYRIWQARTLISSVEIVIDDRHETGPAFVSLSIDRAKTGGYRSTQAVMRSEELTAALLATATAELNAFKTRYRRLAALAGVFREINRLPRSSKKGRPTP